MALTGLQESFLRAAASISEGDDYASKLARQSMLSSANGIPELEAIVPKAWLAECRHEHYGAWHDENGVRQWTCFDCPARSA